MSDTPRTDAFVAGPGWTIARTSAEHFARTLERELNAANEIIRDWKEAADAAMQPNEHEQHCACVGVLQARVRALERDNARLLALATEATSAT